MLTTGSRSNTLMCEYTRGRLPPLTLTLALGKFRDNSGYISFDEFKTVFSANIGADAIPFDFEW